MSDTPQAILLMGPTASGKTGLALELARRFPLEIISVDSALVYRGMDIGSAKPSLAEMAACPHHLIDVITPLQSYSAAQFHADANRLIGEISARGNIPLLVGGTMLYYKALLEGLSDLPQADAALRAELDADAARLGWPALHARLAGLDPATAARLNPNDAQRIHRALEVCLLSGRPMSELIAQGKAAAADFRHLPLALVPRERGWLHQRIAQRFDIMLEQGFLDEVSRLRAQYPDLSLDLPSMRCVGYRQAWEHQDGLYDRREFIERGIAATRQLAKRQLTWTRGLDVMPVDAQQQDLAGLLTDAVADFLAGKPPADALRFSGPF
ncbi:tRNA (adenosine(37)-N6)-dimethylallyltransferase MiaA [Chromobacterium subtsugae]|uniref:tRNA dimethylallyltransferase n=1 Tax=Chromobacterium subtsugae TaxID=251747 RepID=A0ABS7FA92_9NEIS|nr:MULTISPECIES: tRNA (adenosine(37)-N6)-dimethylallyltransferase MiaA [Chromobacterium]KUM04527.1 tRNA dimethylallyltransferase [Chromobacterium subtsugae]KZE87096.1 tRNA dimethylallyltransferase [Chromobacterium sp. F49]MBW7565960.1 tRNA (adenosine(37)-N6)-dimethylallyltransferase MiaA [Chromobacterium subtsugae]MBW8287000.1 tRNA (adenosine(37)-N6)-dimethylallyltransferase MiaA [Chromobacterium subtsugae]OBU88229.1 tRNA delta(2)-isopentenylpyrophosphate transferase [Chromobacterium subtsugae